MSGVLTGTVNLDPDTDREKMTQLGSETQLFSGQGQSPGPVLSFTAFRPRQTCRHLDLEHLISKTSTTNFYGFSTNFMVIFLW